MSPGSAQWFNKCARWFHSSMQNNLLHAIHAAKTSQLHSAACNSFICIHYMALINIRFTHAGEYGLPDGARTPRTRCCLAPCSSNFSNQSLLLLHCAYAACAALGFWKFPKGQQCAPFPLMCLFPHLPNYGFRFFGKFCIAKRFLCSNSCCMLAAKIILKFMMTNFQRQLQRFAKPEKRNENT